MSKICYTYIKQWRIILRDSYVHPHRFCFPSRHSDHIIAMHPARPPAYPSRIRHSGQTAPMGYYYWLHFQFHVFCTITFITGQSYRRVSRCGEAVCHYHRYGIWCGASFPLVTAAGRDIFLENSRYAPKTRREIGLFGWYFTGAESGTPVDTMRRANTSFSYRFSLDWQR